MGQYSSYKDILEKAPENPKQADKIREHLNQLRTKPVKEIGDLYCVLRYKKSRLEKRIKEYNAELRACELLLVDFLETNNLEKIKLPVGTSLSIKDDVYVSVKDKEAWMNYIHENELEHLLSVHYTTMKALVADLMSRGQKTPDGLKPWYRQGIRPYGLPKHLDVEDEPEPSPEDEFEEA